MSQSTSFREKKNEIKQLKARFEDKYGDEIRYTFNDLDSNLYASIGQNPGMSYSKAFKTVENRLMDEKGTFNGMRATGPYREFAEQRDNILGITRNHKPVVIEKSRY